MHAYQSKKEFSAGDIIMKQGDPGDCAYLIEDGQVEIVVERPDGRVQLVGTRGPGAIIGEMALVDAAPRTATVKAIQNCKMLEISHQDYAQRLKTTDPVIQMVSQVILTRYREMLTRAEIISDTISNPAPEELERTFTEQTDVVESIRIANELKAALAANELSLNYQPIIDLHRGEVLGFEALMRWIHPEQGFISPGLFIPIAEKNGLIVELSKWAVEEACTALKRIEQALGKDKAYYMSVNFTSHDFAETDFISGLMNTLQKTGIRPEQLKLEITERLLIQQPDNAKATLEQCRKMGMGISIDDFGTGYSSLSYLYYFPIDTLKVDQSFIRAMDQDTRSQELVKSVIGLGKNMGMTIIAEGVEEKSQSELLRAMGCDCAQGYYFARPMPEDDMLKALADWSPERIRA